MTVGSSLAFVGAEAGLSLVAVGTSMAFVGTEMELSLSVALRSRWAPLSMLYAGAAIWVSHPHSGGGTLYLTIRVLRMACLMTDCVLGKYPVTAVDVTEAHLPPSQSENYSPISFDRIEHSHATEGYRDLIIKIGSRLSEQ